MPTSAYAWLRIFNSADFADEIAGIIYHDFRTGEFILAQFGLLYVGEPQFGSPEEAQAHQQEFFAWVGSLGEAVVNPGMPFGPPTRVDANGVSSEARADRLTGVTIVEAEDMDAALEIAKSCPYVEVAALDVVEIFQMNG